MNEISRNNRTAWVTMLELSYDQGNRAAWVTMLGECVKNLGYDSLEARAAAWIVEREQALSILRELCTRFGDNDWADSLHLADIVEKHLADHLYEAIENDKERPPTIYGFPVKFNQDPAQTDWYITFGDPPDWYFDKQVPENE